MTYRIYLILLFPSQLLVKLYLRIWSENDSWNSEWDFILPRIDLISTALPKDFALVNWIRPLSSCEVFES